MDQAIKQGIAAAVFGPFFTRNLFHRFAWHGQWQGKVAVILQPVSYTHLDVYKRQVRSLLNNDREEEREHLTALPAMDMEHFMYRQGFDDVFHRVAMIPVDVPMNMRRVIAKAIHRSSKPDLAIEVATEAGRRGVESVPTLLRKMFSRVLWLARGRAD